LVNRGKHFVVEDEICAPDKTWEDFEVDPESVGQYVLFIDGVDVYEGDIIRKHYTGTLSENDIVGVVTYLHAVLMWYLVAKDRVVGTLGHTSKVAKHTIIGNEYEMKNDLKLFKEEVDTAFEETKGLKVRLNEIEFQKNKV
jgi:hypothetical protein